VSSSTLVYEGRRAQVCARARDYLELTKPKIAVLELATVVVAGLLARWGGSEMTVLLHAVVGTALVAASASAWNQWIEWEVDASMSRTADRPLPAGRLSRREVAWFGTVTVAFGVGYLLVYVNLLTAALGLAAWALYAWVYTPLKTRTWLNTVVGAVAGAMPVLIGWAAVGGSFGLPAAILFVIVFLWQFPHFMAIAWIYRREYGDAGMQMLTVVDPTGRRAGLQAFLAAAALVPVSLLPTVVSFAGAAPFAAALGLAQLACALGFMIARSDASARLLLRASLVYLPALLAWLMLGPFLS